MDWGDILSRYDRIAVTGGPVTGKSRYTDQTHDRPVIHSDEVPYTYDEPGEWSNHSARVKHQAEQYDRFVVAGIAADRAIRKGLEVDVVIHCRLPQKTLTARQMGLKRQIDRRVEQLRRDGLEVIDVDE